MYGVKRFLIGLVGAAACLGAAIPVYAQQASLVFREFRRRAL